MLFKIFPILMTLTSFLVKIWTLGGHFNAPILISFTLSYTTIFEWLIFIIKTRFMFVCLCVCLFVCLFVYFLFVNNNKYLSYVVDNIIFGIVPNCRTVVSVCLVYFVYFISIWTIINLHMTNSKVRNSDSAYLICFSQVLLKLFTFLINAADKIDRQHFQQFSIPLLL